MPTELNDVVSLPDVLVLNHFDLIIPNPPGGIGAKDLTIRNMTATMPVMAEFEPVRVQLHRHAVNYAGKGKVDGILQASYMDTKDKKVTTTLENWYLQIRDETTGLPKPKSGYKADALIQIYDMENKGSVYRTLYNMWIQKVEPISLDGASDDYLKYSVSLVYDYFKLGRFI